MPNARQFRSLAIVLVVLGCLTLLQAQAPQAPASKSPAPSAPVDTKKVMAEARAAYYSLASMGFTGARCSIVPDWKKVLGENVEAAELDQQVKRLDHLKFAVIVNGSGAAIVTHSIDEGADDLDPAGVKQIFDGMDQMVGGVFQTWTPFMVAGLFPADDVVSKLELVGENYKLTYKDGDSDITTMMDKNYQISEVTVLSPQLRATMRPKFEKSPKGFVLTGYDSNFKAVGDPGETNMTVKLENQDVSGFLMISKLGLKILGDKPIVMDLAFSNCQAEKKK